MSTVETDERTTMSKIHYTATKEMNTRLNRFSEISSKAWNAAIIDYFDICTMLWHSFSYMRLRTFRESFQGRVPFLEMLLMSKPNSVLKPMIIAERWWSGFYLSFGMIQDAMDLAVACLYPVYMHETNTLMISVVLDDATNIVRFANRPCI